MNLTPRQLDVLLLIERHIDRTGLSPTYQEIQDTGAFTSKSGVWRCLQGLIERGYIRMTPNLARSIEVIKPSEGPRYPLPKHLEADVKSYARKNHITPATVIAEAVTAYLGLELVSEEHKLSYL